MNATKQKLVQAYHILSHLGLDDHTYTHLSAREGNAFYISPFGLRYKEVSYDNLLKVTFDGEILEGSEFQYNKTGYMIHGAVYQGRQDINAIFHIHTPEIVAVSACKDGLLPISQWALHFYERLSYHPYNSLELTTEQSKLLVNNLGQNYTMLMQNHGSATCGRTIEEAMFYTHHLQMACRTQCLAMHMPLSLPSHELCKQAVHDLLSFEENLGQRDWEAWVRLI